MFSINITLTLYNQLKLMQRFKYSRQQATEPQQNLGYYNYEEKK